MRATPVCIGGNSSVSKNVLGTALLSSLPQECVLQEHTRGADAGVNHAEPPIEHAAMQQVLTPEARRRAQRQIAPRGAPAAGRQVVGTHAAVGDQLVEMVAQIAVGRVLELV